MGPGIWSSSAPTWGASPSSLLVNSEARTSPITGSTARCSFRQVRFPDGENPLRRLKGSFSSRFHNGDARVDRPRHVSPCDQAGGEHCPAARRDDHLFQADLPPSPSWLVGSRCARSRSSIPPSTAVSHHILPVVAPRDWTSSVTGRRPGVPWPIATAGAAHGAAHDQRCTRHPSLALLAMRLPRALAHAATDPARYEPGRGVPKAC